MAKVSRKRSKSLVKGVRTKRPKRSRTMKKAKKGMSMKKIMNDSQKPRKVYCVSCRKKVTVEDYEITKTPKGAYQLIGKCLRKDHKLDKNGEKKVYSFVGAKDV